MPSQIGPYLGPVIHQLPPTMKMRGTAAFQKLLGTLGKAKIRHVLGVAAAAGLGKHLHTLHKERGLPERDRPKRILSLTGRQRSALAAGLMSGKPGQVLVPSLVADPGKRLRVAGGVIGGSTLGALAVLAPALVSNAGVKALRSADPNDVLRHLAKITPLANAAGRVGAAGGAFLAHGKGTETKKLRKP